MSLHGALAEATRKGHEILEGEATVTASLAIAVPFATISSVNITQKTAVAPGLNSSVYTWNYAAGVLTIYAWKPTSATNPTLIAGTVASTVSYMIVGKRR